MGARSKKNEQPRGGVAPSWRKANIQVHKEHSYQLGEEWQRFFKLLLRYRHAVDGLVHHDEQADALDHFLSEATLADGKIRARGRRETRLF